MRRRDWVSVGCGGLATALSIFAVGGAFRWTQAIVAALLAIGLLAQLPSRRKLSKVSPLIALLATASALTAFSLIPLPEALRGVLDPAGTALREDGAALLDLAPWPALSRDVPGSLRALIFFVTLLGVAVLALRFATSTRDRFRLLGLVSILCGLTALVTIAHEIVGATRLYGFYEKQASPNVLGPLLNQNHLGGLMAIGTCISLGLVMFPSQRSAVRVVWMADVLLCGAITAASGSRGALIAVGAGGALAVGIMVAQRFLKSDRVRRHRSKFVTSSLPIALVGACVVVLVVYSSAGSVSAKFESTTLDEVNHPRSKFAAWKSSEGLIKESPWVGVGRGGLEPSFARFHATSGALTVAFLENEYIQAVVDWGIPGALLIAGALLWFVAIAVRRWREGPLTAGALGAMLAIAIQSNVDYGVELLGLAVPVTIIASTLAYVPLREETEKKLALARGMRAAHVVALLLAAMLLLGASTRSIAEDHERFLKHTPSMNEVRVSLQHHPMDYFGYAIASQVAGESKSISLLNHAMRLHPVHPDLHRRAAHLLLRGGHTFQAAIEFSAAVRSSQQPERVVAEIVATFSPDIAATAIPFDYPNLDRMVGALHELKHDDVATLWLMHVLDVRPRDVHACNILYDLSLKQGDLKAAEIAGRSCVALMPDRQTRRSLAELLLKRGEYSEVVRMLSDVASWQGLVTERSAAWLLLCDAHIGLEHLDEATSCLRHLDAAGDLAADHHDEITKRIEVIQQKRAAKSLGSATELGSGERSSAHL